MLERLRAFLRPDLPSAGVRDALEAMERRVRALEAGQADCLEVVQLEAERAARWADMANQLRRLLGRLDAHAGKDRQAEDTGGRDPKQLAALLRTKFPNAGV